MTNQIKNGVKTTEFWVSLATGVFGILVTVGVFTPEQAADLTTAVQTLAGSVITAIGAAAYGISRGLAKKDVPNANQQ